MRIAYLSAFQIPSRAANSVHVMRMCQSFAANGHEVALFAAKSSLHARDEFRYYGVSESFKIVKSWRPAMRFAGFWIYARGVNSKLVSGPRPDLLYCRDRLCTLVAARLRIPFVFEVHDLASGIKRAIEKRLFRKKSFARLVAISNCLRNEYLQQFPELCAEKVIVAPDGADPPQVGGPTHDAAASGGRPGCLQVGYIGHLYPGRGVEIIVELARRRKDVDFHIVGGNEKDVGLWKSRANRLSNVRFHGFVEPSKTDYYRHTMDVLIAPYQENVYTESGAEIARWFSPLKVFEYMAAGKAIVASDLPALREILEHNVTALIIPPNDLNAWDEAIRSLRDDRLRERLGLAAKAKFEEAYTWRERARRVVAGLVP